MNHQVNPEVAAIAARILELRRISELTAEAVAADCGIPVEKYLDYEEGRADIPVGILQMLSRKFQVEITTLLTGEDPKLRSFALTRSGQGVEVNRRSDYQYRSLAHNFAHRKGEPFLVSVEPKAETVPLNSHPGQEFNYVLEGRLLISIKGQELILEPGDSLYYDSGLPHGMRALGDEPAQFLSLIF